MVGLGGLLSWICAVSGVYGAASSPIQDSGENCGVNVVFLLKELPRYVPKNVKTIIPLTAEQIRNDKLDKYIAEALKYGHKLALSSKIPQSTRKSELQVFQNNLRESKQIVQKKFGYELKGLYNFDKMSVMSSVEKAAEAVGFDLFTRSFRANLMNLDVLSMQIKQAAQDKKRVVVQVSIKSRPDILRLDDFVRELAKTGYCVVGANENSAESLHSTSDFEESLNTSKIEQARETPPQKASAVKKKPKASHTNRAPLSPKKSARSATYHCFSHSLHQAILASLICA